MVEFEPFGFVYIGTNKTTFFTAKRSMYSIENRGEMIWQDEDGETHRHSHFSTAGIDKEKRCLLRIRQDDGWHFIPAVKKDDKYLNLVSME